MPFEIHCIEEWQLRSVLAAFERQAVVERTWSPERPQRAEWLEAMAYAIRLTLGERKEVDVGPAPP